MQCVLKREIKKPTENCSIILNRAVCIDYRDILLQCY